MARRDVRNESMNDLQAKSTNTLALCPFCGGEASKRLFYKGKYRVHCNVCDAHSGDVCDTEAEAIAAWNARAERTCYADEVTHRDCKYSVNRGWKERTCECVAEYAESPIDGKKIVLHRCSACYELMRPHMRYCPSCGREVVGE